MEVGSVLPFLFKYYHSITNKMFLRNLVPGKDEIIVEVTRDDFNDRTKVFSRHWLLYGKILDLNQKKMRVSIKLSDVWDKNYHVSGISNGRKTISLFHSFARIFFFQFTGQFRPLRLIPGNNDQIGSFAKEKISSIQRERVIGSISLWNHRGNSTETCNRENERRRPRTCGGKIHKRSEYYRNDRLDRWTGANDSHRGYSYLDTRGNCRR